MYLCYRSDWFIVCHEYNCITIMIWGKTDWTASSATPCAPLSSDLTGYLQFQKSSWEIFLPAWAFSIKSFLYSFMQIYCIFRKKKASGTSSASSKFSTTFSFISAREYNQSCAVIYLLWNQLLMPRGWLWHTASNAWKKGLAPSELSSKLTQFKQIEQGSSTEKFNKTKENVFPGHAFAKVQKMALDSRERYLTNIHPFKYIEF